MRSRPMGEQRRWRHATDVTTSDVRRHRRLSAAASVVMLLTVVAAVVVAPTRPAAAGIFPTWGYNGSDVGTWVDGTGRLHAAWVSVVRQSGVDSHELLTVRHTLDGRPDPGWGTDPRTGAAGVRRTPIAPPTGTLAQDVALGTDATGASPSHGRPPGSFPTGAKPPTTGWTTRRSSTGTPWTERVRRGVW